MPVIESGWDHPVTDANYASIVVPPCPAWCTGVGESEDYTNCEDDYETFVRKHWLSINDYVYVSQQESNRFNVITQTGPWINVEDMPDRMDAATARRFGTAMLAAAEKLDEILAVQL